MEAFIKPNTTKLIRVENITDYTFGYAVINVNSYRQNLTLSYNETLIQGYYETGLHLGLVMTKKSLKKHLIAYLHNDNEAIVYFSLALIVYDSKAPIIGDCNLEMDIETSPILKMSINREEPRIIEIGTPLAKLSRLPMCPSANITYDTYYYSLNREDNTMRSYFDGILRMLDVMLIKTNGKMV